MIEVFVSFLIGIPLIAVTILLVVGFAKLPFMKIKGSDNG